VTTFLIAALSFLGFIVAYHTYGRWLARKIFALDPNACVPSQELRDDLDFVPTKKEVIFGHHFTSIAGTGPIVGPAIAVFWGWLPALLWVVIGSVFIGAVHDFGALVVSLRNRGQTIGDIAGRMISPRARMLLFLILFFALTLVLAIFGLVIAVIFAFYPQSVLSVWIEIPLAVAIGLWVYKKKGDILIPSLLALAAMYLAIWIGAYYYPIDLQKWLKVPLMGPTFANAIVIWTLILFVYCFVASVLPVWTLLQPRDFINSHELFLALGLLVLGLCVAAFTGQADLVGSAPAIAKEIPPDAPPIWPFLFITIACGAVSGFHCLVSSGTTSKQISCETDAQCVGYGSMMLEATLAVVVILACCAGIGMGVKGKGDVMLKGREAWMSRYQAYDIVERDGQQVKEGRWSKHGLPQKVGAFVDGGANFINALGIPLPMALGIMAVLVASFAATTLDTATRIQRYVIQEISEHVGFKPLTDKYAATALALLLGGALALTSGPKGPGSGGLILWPMFGAMNQLLAGLAFMVIAFYLVRRNKPVWFLIAPMLIMAVLPAWAMLWQIFSSDSHWLATGHYKKLVAFGVVVLSLQFWLIVEGLLALKGARGNYPELEPLPAAAGAAEAPETRN